MRIGNYLINIISNSNRCLLLFSLFLSSLLSSQEQPHIYNLPPGEKPVEVATRFYLSDLNNINEETETIEIKGLLELRWQDNRQAFDPGPVGDDYKLYQGTFQFLEVYQGWYPHIVIANSVGPTPLEGVTLFNYADGGMRMIQEISVELKSSMDLRRYPFDKQTFLTLIEPLAFDDEQFKFVYGEGKTDMPERYLRVAGWRIDKLDYKIESVNDDLNENRFSQMVIQLDMTRLPGSTIWLVFVPLTVIIFLSSSIYWMDNESLGARMDISFLGLLTIVAYQSMVKSGLPDIDYFTLTNGFVYNAYFIMGLFIVSNIINSQLDKKGKRELADRLDLHARWVMPLFFILLNVASAVVFYNS